MTLFDRYTTVFIATKLKVAPCMVIESSTVYGPSSTIGVLLKIDLPWTKTYLLWHDTVDDEKSRKESRIKINKLNKTFLRLGHKTKIV